MPIALTPILYQPGDYGSPILATALPSLYGRLSRYSHTIANGVGFESCSLQFGASLEEALFWTQQLMASIVVYDEGAGVAWEGYLDQVDVTAGQETRSLSLRTLANALRCRYTTVLGTPGATAWQLDSASVLRYGRKEQLLSLNTTTQTAATNYAATMLAMLRQPQMAPQSSVTSGTDGGEVSVTLTGAGWYTTLEWATLGRTDTTLQDTGTQVSGLFGGYFAVNNFFNQDFRFIPTTGVSDTRAIDADTTYREAIEARLGQGTSAGQRLAWGVYEGRTLIVAPWAGATPGAPAYRRRLADGVLLDAAGVVVPPWAVRPDAMVETVDLLDAGPVMGAIDAAARFYLERVSCEVSGDRMGVSLEPAASDALGAALAAKGNRRWL